MSDVPHLDHLWAGWRLSYIAAVTQPGDTSLDPDENGSLFERVLSLPDDEGMVVHRGTSCSVLLNAYPYTSGHLLVVPNRAVAELEGLTDEELEEMAHLSRDAVIALKSAYLHTHVLPRWDADSNFMTSIALARVLPEPLDATLQKVRAAWPT